MRVAIALLLMLVANISRADIITFRSGDHPDFARLVADIPVGTPWLIGRLAAGYALQLDPGASFDTSLIFDRIQRNRLASVAEDPGTGRLRLNLACECHIDAFLFAPDKLVIDIKDGPAPASSRFEVSLSGPEPQQQASLPLQFPRRNPDPAPEVPFLPDTFETVTADPGITAAERALIDSLGRAASQGLLDIDPSVEVAAEPATPTLSVLTEPQPAGVTSVQPLQDLPIATDSLGIATDQGIRIQTVTDRDRLSGGTLPVSSCLDDGHFDVAAWSESMDFATEIGSRRAKLIGEDDHYSSPAIETLARAYLYFGFGQEAIAALALDGVRTADRDIILALGQIIDEKPVTGSVFASQAGCARSVALWRALASDSLEGTTEPERIAISTTYRVLPYPLRALLSDRTAGLFLAAGDVAAAQAILAPTAVTGPSGEDAMTAAVAYEVDGPAAALETLEKVVAEDARASPEAVAALIQISIDESRPVDEALLSLAGALRFENRGTPEALTLGTAEFKALLFANRFTEAVSVLSELEELPENDRAAYLAEVSVSISENATDREFLEWFFDNRLDLSSSRSENAAAKRMFDLGFTAEAARLIEGPAIGADMEERRYLRAEIANATGQITNVEEILAGMSDPRAVALRERTPPSVADREDRVGSAIEQSWRDGAWTQLDSSDDPTLQAAANAMLTEPALTDRDSSLADREALIADAENTRELARELLERFQIASEPESLRND